MTISKFLVVGLMAVSINVQAASNIEGVSKTDLQTTHKYVNEFADNLGNNLWNGTLSNSQWKHYHSIFKSLRDNDPSIYPNRCSRIFKKLQADYNTYETEGVAQVIHALNLNEQGPAAPVIKNGKINISETIAKEVYTGDSSLILQSKIHQLRREADLLAKCSKIKPN